MAMKEGGSLSRPPMLGDDFGTWKYRMKPFFVNQNNDSWYYVENKYVWPSVTKPATEASPSTSTLKDKKAFTEDEDKAYAANWAALNIIFMAMPEDKFKLVSTCETAYEAWETLKHIHEGSSKVRETKLQMIATEFENLRMKEDEVIDEFHSRVKDLTNRAFQFGKSYKEVKLVRKVLKSLPKRFSVKLTAIA